MWIVSRRTLRAFWEKHADAKEQLQAWFAIAEKAEWKTPADVKTTFGKASIVSGNRVVFDIKGNAYRLVVKMAYRFGKCWIRWIGTHADYDKIDVTTV